MRQALSLFLTLLVMCCLTSAYAQQDQALTAKQAKALYDKADKALNEAWAAVKAALPESEFNKLKEEQRNWVAYRDYLARSPMFTGADTQGELSLDAPEYLEAAAGLADMRTRWLKGLVRDWKAEETLTGEWTDSYGGSVQVVEQEGRLYFFISVVRGPTSHGGDISGIATWNAPIGWFSDKGRDTDKTDETNLSFVLRDKRLEVIGANTGYYHGARAYFDGEYVKVQQLDAGTQAKVVHAAKTGKIPEE